MAEGLLRAKVRENNLDWEIDSCGTGNYHVGEAPDRRAQEMMMIKGYSIAGHRAQQLTADLISKFDKIYCMDEQNYKNAISLASANDRAKISLLLEELPDGDYSEVPDPYFNNQFYLVYNLLDEVTDKIVEKYQ